MKRIFIVVFLLASACTRPTPEVSSPERPNILILVADDLGFSDIAPFGGNIHTPILEQLSREGMLFSNFYVLPTCSPSRSALLTGNDNHVTGIGVMSEVRYPALEGMSGYTGHLNDQVVTLPEILRESGYHTYMAGKWHLGDGDQEIPSARGFEESFSLLQGGGSHYADQNPLSPPQVMDYRVNGKKIDALPSDFYSTKNYTDTLIHYIDKHKGDGKPFFMYAAYTAPHDPLHAPKEYIDKYHGKFDMGWDSLRVLRLENLKTLGIVPQGVNTFAPSGIPAWSSLSPEHQEELAKDMEVYAAMVEYLDMSIGRIIDYLKKEGMYDNTLIVFLSDNGANGVMATTYPGNGDGVYLGGFDNSLQNRGLHNSFIEMGPGWAQVSSSPFRLFKSFASEGGIRAPLIVKMPNANSGKGLWNKSFFHVTDLMPTFLELAQASYPQEFKGKAVRQPIGKSMRAVLDGNATEIHASEEGMGWELFERKAYIQGKWKILRLPPPFGPGEWQLFDRENDPGETTDLSAQYPEIKEKLIQNWQEYAKDNDVFDHKGHYDTLFSRSLGSQK
ncbi:arylsulfatase AtsA [Algoriphagus confluentis]|uniref:Arylsulfatase AtsA n=2 Tax=Algoriphagus confluentis TaxID=1697556 RepID=A0ABQ6PS44_9BACT|nr:arylsulfatase AtsA [Algoriphagus confluentis]